MPLKLSAFCSCIDVVKTAIASMRVLRPTESVNGIKSEILMYSDAP